MNKKKIIFTNCGGNNAGDKYSLPSLFYNFENYRKEYTDKIWDTIENISNHQYQNCIIIFGGGGIIDLNEDRSKQFKTLENNDTNIYFHWGSGENLTDNALGWVKDTFSNFVFVGRRDYYESYPPNQRYVPCVSCKLPQLKLNYNIKRTIGIVQHTWLHPINHLDYPSINMDLFKYSIDDIIRFIGESEVIITSSYHATYWALLLGKKVIISKSWSTKFDYLKYKPTILTDNLDEDILKTNPAPQDYLDESIYINDNFYSEIMNYIK